MQEFTSRYGSDESGRYVLTRDLATYAIMKEVEAGRGSPHGGAYLSFQHSSKHELQAAFGPVIDRLAANNVDLTKTAVEVAPIAHYHMGGVRVNAQMQTRVPGLLAAGEAVGGANGANRLSGNAITEALVFGRRAGLAAADHAPPRPDSEAGPAQLIRPGSPRHIKDLADAARALGADGAPACDNPATLIAQLQSVMSERVGAFRTESGLASALVEIADLRDRLGAPPPPLGHFDTARLDWFDAHNMLIVAEAVARSALGRRESRGAHQREDHPKTGAEWSLHQVLRLDSGRLTVGKTPADSPPLRAGQTLKGIAKDGAMD